MNRTTRVPVSAAMLEFAISGCDKWRSSLIDLVRSGGKAYLGRCQCLAYSLVNSKSVLPTPERNEEAPPREEEHPAILVDRIEHRNRSSLPVDRVDDRSRPEN